MKRFNWLLLIGVLFAHGALGQTNETLALLPKLLPASPEAASFAKYGNFPVNLFSGTPDISIPIFEIKSGELDVPITINYHASGIRVNDYGSWVGLGWDLNAGGMITRKTMGKPDDQAGNYLSGQTVRVAGSINTNSQSDLDYLRGVYNGTYDCEPDIFSYSFPGKNGKFLYNQPNNFVPIIIPYDPIIISRNSNLFDITDERGVSYQFHDGEYTTSSAAGTVTQGMSTWVLTKMLSVNKQDTISFSYSQRFGQVSQDMSDLVIVNDLPTNYESSAPVDLGSNYSYTSFVSADERKIQEIDFLNGKIVFDASSADRLDGFTGQKSLSDIRIYSYDPASLSYKLLKQINFYQSYFTSTPDNAVRSLRLDSISITDNGNAPVEKYRFTYNTQQLPRKDSKARDYWGYYNGKANNILVPQMLIPYQDQGLQQSTITIGSTVANGRDADPAYMQAAMLKRIYYPTGGYTEFTFETNKYKDIQNNTFNAGGLRIKSIASYDAVSATPVVKTYMYGDGESGTGRANFILNNYFFQTTQTNQYISYALVNNISTPIRQWSRRQRTFCSNPSLDIEPYDGSLVVYPTVTEYTGDGTSNTGKTIYYYTDIPDGVSETFATNHPVIRTYHINRGQLAKKEIYISKGGGTYQIASSVANTYEAFPETIYPNVGIVVFKSVVTDDTNGSDIALCPQGSGCLYNDSHSYLFANYDARSDDDRLIQTVETDYDQSDIARYAQTWTHYYYDNFLHQQVTRIFTVNSLGDTIKIIKKYPQDFATTAPYNTMISLNIINKVVQEQKLDNNTQLTLQTNNYLDKGNGNYLPDNITYQIAANPPETRANFNSYDQEGNILEMQKTNDAKQSLIWDYRKQFPVAEVLNAGRDQIAYTSFEADGNGNWSISDQARSPEGLTGNQSFVLKPGNNINYYFSSAGFSFILSYWSKDGPVNINGVTLVSTLTGPSKNGWTYYEHIISASTGNGMSLTANSAKTIDELRLYPATAQMTTRTYAALTGITSQCSQNNIVTYFNYDRFNRLKSVRDADGNILKSMEYNYQTNIVY
jgi:hypothetical protein